MSQVVVPVVRATGRIPARSTRGGWHNRGDRGIAVAEIGELIRLDLNDAEEMDAALARIFRSFDQVQSDLNRRFYALVVLMAAAMDDAEIVRSDNFEPLPLVTLLVDDLTAASNAPSRAWVGPVAA